MMIALYARVSTTRQAENDLSIPDQLRQMRAWAERNGHIIVKEYIEPGASATDDKRPLFQDMMNDAAAKPALFEAVIVHSLSRFFRDLVMGAMYQKTLKKAGVQLISITQQTQNDPSGDMQRNIIMMFDEYQSKEIAKHTLRGMKENARQGYFNGSNAPFGYQTIDAGQTGLRGRMKKKLAIDPAEAEIVREIFTLYVHGINAPRMGMKEIAKTLNARGTLMRGKLWRIQAIQLILSSLTYSGWHVFNKLDSKSRKIKDEAEWVKIPVPAIIDQETFDAATKLRASFALKNKDSIPRREVSDNLLTGLIRYGHCDSGMTVVTGKGGRYRYYKCVNRMSKGNISCPSDNIPADLVEKQVLDIFRQKIASPDHIRGVLEELRHQLAKQQQGGDEKQQLKKLEAELRETEQAQSRLLDAIERGMVELDDQLKTRVQQHKTKKQAIDAEIANLKRQTRSPLLSLTPQKIDAVAKIVSNRLQTPSAYARAYLKATLSEIRVRGDNLKISGARSTLANLVAADGDVSGNLQGKSVPRFVPEWRAGQDKSEYWNMELSIPAAPQFASRKKAREPALG